MIRLSFRSWLENTDADHIYIPAGGKGLPRHEMPQISRQHFDDYFAYLGKHGAKVHRAAVRAGDLKPIQGEINQKMVRSIMGLGKGGFGKPVIVSADDFILDGHHRWLALLQTDPDAEMDAWKVETDMDTLLRLTKAYPNALYADINFGLTGGTATGTAPPKTW